MGLEVVVEAYSLTKEYGDLVAVDGIDFQVYKGECCGFLGSNGAGKTTTVRMIHCFLPPTSGKLTVAGMEV
jgi:ABC-type multidrug transport system ATPase subunit